MKKRIFYYATFLVGFLFVAGTGVAQAAVSLPDFSNATDLPAFISSVYSFALTVVGIAVFIRILYAGFLMLTAAGNSSKFGDAKNKMQNAVIGAILLFSAYLILYIINPDLVKNTFNLTIPGASQQPAVPAAPTTETSPTAGPLVISGIIIPGQKATSFYPAPQLWSWVRGLPIARAQEGVYVFTVEMVDRNGDTCSQTYNMEVVPRTAVLNDAKDSVGKKYYAALLNAVSAQEENGSDAIQIIKSGGCVISTKVIPDAIENTPYYAEIIVAGEAPYAFKIEDGELPEGLGIVPALDMPVLTIKNLTAQRTPSYAFKVGDTFRLDLTGAKPNSDVYFKWFKNGTAWHYPDITPNSNGWAKYGITNENGDWANQAAFTTNEIGIWQEYAMVNGKVSRVIEFQILAPEVRIIVSTPAPKVPATAFNTPIYGGGGGGCQAEQYCENRETGAKSDILTDAEAQAQSIAIGSSDRCPGTRQVFNCTYSAGASQQSGCNINQFQTRSCMEEMGEVRRADGTIDTSNIPHSDSGVPPSNVEAGSLYTVDQYAGSMALGGNNFLVGGRYSDQVQAVQCGNGMSGEFCTPGQNAGSNGSWCAGQTDANGNLINPPAAP